MDGRSGVIGIIAAEGRGMWVNSCHRGEVWMIGVESLRYVGY